MRPARSTVVIAAIAAVAVTVGFCGAPSAASAGVPSVPCNLVGDANGLAGKACDLLRNPSQLLDLGKKLVTGHLGSVIGQIFGGGGAPSASTALGLAAVVAWILGGAKVALAWMVKAIGGSTAPQLGAIWFSSTYWRVAAIAALLTLPFLFAAAVQALMRSDLSLVSRAAFGYLPLAMLCVALAAPLTMLLLAASDELCALVWSPSSGRGLTSLLTGAGGVAGMVGLIKSPFLAFLLGLFTATGAVLVWLELIMREAAVYIVVLLLPLAFAALVWPARKIWALRAAELLVALILSKFAIVAVLGLGGAALNHAGSHGVAAILAGMVLVIMAAFAPWAVLRLVPVAEVASSTASALRQHTFGPLVATWDASGERFRDAKAATGALRGRLALATSGAERGSPLAPAAGEASASSGADALGPGPLQAASREADGSDGHAEQPTGSSTQGGVTALGSDDAAERVPGAAPIWQAPDMSWRPMTLGPDDGWPPPPLFRGDGAPSEADGPASAHGPGGAVRSTATGPADGSTGRSEGGPAAEDSDALPPLQDPGGRL